MGRYQHSQFVAAPPEQVFDLWIDVERMPEWIVGVTAITDVSGPLDRAGTRYVVHFGRVTSPTEVLEAERPRLFRTHFGNLVLRGVSETTFEPSEGGTRVTQRLETEGFISAIMARVFASGSYEGSFAGELATFARIAGEATAPDRPDP